MHGHWVDPRRRRRRRRGAAVFRSSSACTDRTSTSPRRSAPARRAAGARLRARRVRSPRAAPTSAAARSRSAPSADRVEVVPYGVDADRFRPDPLVRARRRASLGIATAHAAALRGRTAGAQEGIRVPDRRARGDCRRRWTSRRRSPAPAIWRPSCAQQRRRRAHRRPRALPRQPLAGRGRGAGWRPPTWSPSRRCATTAATSTACRTSCSRRWRRARRSSRRPPAASASVVEHGRTGVLVPERDASALAEAIRHARRAIRRCASGWARPRARR